MSLLTGQHLRHFTGDLEYWWRPHGGFSPQLGDTFEVMTFDSRVGGFTEKTGLDIGGALTFVTVFDDEAGSLFLVVRACGDQNDDGVWDILDAVIDLQIAAGLLEPSPAQSSLHGDAYVRARCIPENVQEP